MGMTKKFRKDGNEYVTKQAVSKPLTNREKISRLVEKEVCFVELIRSMDSTIKYAEKDVAKAEREVKEALKRLTTLNEKIAAAPKRKAGYESQLKTVRKQKKKLTNPDYKKLQSLQKQILQLQAELKKDQED